VVGGQADYWSRTLDALYSGIEALPTTGYRLVDSDRWQRARTLIEAAARGHLLVLIWIVGISSVAPHALTMRAQAAFAFRYVPDDDAGSQSRLQAATAHLVDHIEGFGLADGTRVVAVTSADVAPADEQWIDVLIDFSLRVPRDLRS